MPQRNPDRSQSRVVKMPRLHDDTMEASIWFERGMMWLQDPTDPEQVCHCTVDELEERLESIYEYIRDDDLCHKFVCGKQAARRFIIEAEELIKASRAQMHVGMPIDVIAKEEASHTPVSRRQGFETPGLLAVPAGSSGDYQQRASGLLVPGSN